MNKPIKMERFIKYVNDGGREILVEHSSDYLTEAQYAMFKRGERDYEAEIRKLEIENQALKAIKDSPQRYLEDYRKLMDECTKAKIDLTNANQANSSLLAANAKLLQENIRLKNQLKSIKELLR